AIKELNLNVLQGNFNESQFDRDKYDLIVAWYFIEHHKDFLATLDKIKSLLKKGGVLGLSTPNTHGTSFLNNPVKYISKIPKDHFIEFSPRSLSLLLKNEGFRVEKIVMTGLHFDRFTQWFGVSLPKYRWLKQFVLWVLKMIRFGDTFEIYARKL
ncbi:MAG TPA: class I SAM-dependent methyltransferase, partial [Spirochaetes bacterium]|nr:class I SAM-dependent methyltransferase [Spirochaetota bacterium]